MIWPEIGYKHPNLKDIGKLSDASGDYTKRNYEKVISWMSKSGTADMNNNQNSDMESSEKSEDNTLSDLMQEYADERFNCQLNKISENLKSVLEIK